MVRPPDPPTSRPRRRIGRQGAVLTRAVLTRAVLTRAILTRAVRAVGAAFLAVLLCSPSGAPSAATVGLEGRSTPVQYVQAQYVQAPYVPEWSWPLAPVPEVLRPFEKPPQRWKRGHRGVDLATRASGVGGVGGVGGSVRVLSPADGIVSFAGIVVDRGVLSIDHGDGQIGRAHV